MQNPYAPRGPPPPLRHPVPTHPPRKPEFPKTPTPTASTSSQTSPPDDVAARRIQGLDGVGGSYMRFASPPVPQNKYPTSSPAAGQQNQNQYYGGASTAAASAARSFGGSVQNA